MPRSCRSCSHHVADGTSNAAPETTNPAQRPGSGAGSRFGSTSTNPAPFARAWNWLFAAVVGRAGQRTLRARVELAACWASRARLRKTSGPFGECRARVPLTSAWVRLSASCVNAARARTVRQALACACAGFTASGFRPVLPPTLGDIPGPRRFSSLCLTVLAR